MLELPYDFGRYVLTHLIGEGGMAEVYLASVRVAEGLTKRVVVKKIRREYADQREFMRMFIDEAKIALSLNHANIVQVFDFGQVDSDFYLAMEHVDGDPVTCIVPYSIDDDVVELGELAMEPGETVVFAPTNEA